MRILFVSCQFGMLSRIDCGASIRSTMLVKALTALGQVDVISFYKEPIQSNISNCDVIYCRNIPNDNNSSTLSINDKFKIYLKLLCQPWNPMNYFSLNKEREAVVLDYYKQKDYDLVVCRYINDAISCGLMKFSSKLVVDVDDNLTSVYKSNYCAYSFRYPWSRYIYLYKIKAVGIMSKWFLRRIKLSFYSNLLEKPYKNSVFLPNVSINENEIPFIKEDTPKRLLLVGALNYGPNIEGTIHFVENIFSIVKKKIPQVELYIIGKSDDSQLLEQLNAIDGVKALGFIEDIITEYINCRVVVVPVYRGSGTCVKFIEGAIMNRPIVSTPIGARGYDKFFKGNNDYMLANNDKEFADKILDLLDSIDKINGMAFRAHRVAMDNFSQRKFCQIVKKSILEQ